MNRRYWFLRVLAMFGSKWAARWEIPVVSSLSELPKGVPGILKCRPFATRLGCTTEYFIPTLNGKYLASMNVDEWWSLGSPFVYPLGNRYKHLAEKWLQETLTHKGNLRWSTDRFDIYQWLK